MARRSGGDASWWSAGASHARPQDLPSWARRHLDEADETDSELAPSPPAPPPTPPRHRRVPAAPAGSRLKGWGLAAACLAAAATSVPLAFSTLAKSDDAYALPRVGTFPVVAPDALPGDTTRDPGSRPEATGNTGTPGTTGGAPGVPVGPDAAAVLPPLAAPAVDVPPRRTVTIAPQAVTRPERTSTTTTSRDRADDSDGDGDTPTSTTRTPRDTDGGGSGGSGSGSGGSSSEEAAPSRGTSAASSDDSGDDASGGSGNAERRSSSNLVHLDVELPVAGLSVSVR